MTVHQVCNEIIGWCIVGALVMALTGVFFCKSRGMMFLGGEGVVDKTRSMICLGFFASAFVTAFIALHV